MVKAYLMIPADAPENRALNGAGAFEIVQTLFDHGEAEAVFEALRDNGHIALDCAFVK